MIIYDVLHGVRDGEHGDGHDDALPHDAHDDHHHHNFNQGKPACSPGTLRRSAINQGKRSHGNFFLEIVIDQTNSEYIAEARIVTLHFGGCQHFS